MSAQPEGSGEGGQREAVVVGARGRAGAAPAGLAEVVATLLWRGRGRDHALRQIAVSARQVEDKPVDEAAGGRGGGPPHQRPPPPPPPPPPPMRGGHPA